MTPPLLLLETDTALPQRRCRARGGRHGASLPMTQLSCHQTVQARGRPLISPVS